MLSQRKLNFIIILFQVDGAAVSFHYIKYRLKKKSVFIIYILNIIDNSYDYW